MCTSSWVEQVWNTSTQPRHPVTRRTREQMDNNTPHADPEQQAKDVIRDTELGIIAELDSRRLDMVARETVEKAIGPLQ